MEEIMIYIPEELRKNIEQLKAQEGIEMSDIELYQHLVQLGLEAAEKRALKNEGE